MSSKKPVVCHMTIALMPFDPRIFHKECAALVKAGYEVHLVVRHKRDEVVDGVHIHALPEPPNRAAKILFWPWVVYRKVLSLRPLPAVCHFYDPPMLLAGMALRLKGFKVIFDVRENVADQILTKYYIPKGLRKIASLVYRFAEAIMTSGMATVHVLDSIACRYRHPKVVVRNLPKLSVIPSGLSRARRKCPRLIYVGGITIHRGAITMIELAGELKRRKVDFELRIVGETAIAKTEQKMRAMIAEKSLEKEVALLGQMPYEQALLEVASADIGLCVLHPIPNHLNSLATKILEYMQYELPVVASDFPCWREYVTGTGSGVLVDPLDVEKIADGVQWLLERPDEMRRMGQRGRKAVLERYNWEKEQEKLLAFYERLLSR